MSGFNWNSVDITNVSNIIRALLNYPRDSALWRSSQIAYYTASEIVVRMNAVGLNPTALTADQVLTYLVQGSRRNVFLVEVLSTGAWGYAFNYTFYTDQRNKIFLVNGLFRGVPTAATPNPYAQQGGPLPIAQGLPDLNFAITQGSIGDVQIVGCHCTSALTTFTAEPSALFQPEALSSVMSLN